MRWYQYFFVYWEITAFLNMVVFKTMKNIVTCILRKQDPPQSQDHDLIGGNILRLQDHGLKFGKYWWVSHSIIQSENWFIFIKIACKIREECFNILRFYIKKIKIELKCVHLEDKIWHFPCMYKSFTWSSQVLITLITLRRYKGEATFCNNWDHFMPIRLDFACVKYR